MPKEFLCPKCRSLNVKVTLSDGTVLKSLGNKLQVEGLGSGDRPLDLQGALTRCKDCGFEFSPKCLEIADLA